ncbi:MAG TPA: DEAD/DEAH box helicase [Bradyrhizobium sp.]|nr:DEAD/DEAH box helicase [Bradyrhizobium sp.]
MPRFSDLGLSPPILGALAAEGYAAPTPIQSQAIPPVLRGRDLCGIAQTGTGKTAAFALPILQRLAAAPQRAAPHTCRVLALSPTRELASQIAVSFRAYGAGMPLSTAVVFGGVPIGPQRQKLARGIDILVATPGRLLDLIDTRSLTLSSVHVLVLDEADRMLDLGFIHALKRIVKLLPQQRQTLLFSATMPRPIALLAEDYLTDPIKVVVAPSSTKVDRVEQGVVFVPSDRKRDLLATLLRDPVLARVLVFTRTKHGADRVVRHLVSAGIEATAIHGNKSQPQRERALAGFRDGQTRVLVATDIAARGIDVDGVSHVNFELPNVPEDYVHRIGRTARAGAAGTAIAFCSDEERPYLRDIEKLTRCSLRAIPLAIPAPGIGAIERLGKATLPWDASLASRQATARGRDAPARHPPRPAGADVRHRDPPVTGSFPAFLRRPSSTKRSSVGRRSERRGRSV